MKKSIYQLGYYRILIMFKTIKPQGKLDCIWVMHDSYLWSYIIYELWM